MKKYEDQLMKFAITKDKLKMEISLKDLVWLFHISPNNTYDGENIGAKVKRGKKQEFADYIVRHLLDDSEYDANNTAWAQPFEDAFNDLLEGAEFEFIKYYEENE